MHSIGWPKDLNTGAVVEIHVHFDSKPVVGRVYLAFLPSFSPCRGATGGIESIFCYAPVHLHVGDYFTKATQTGGGEIWDSKTFASSPVSSTTEQPSSSKFKAWWVRFRNQRLSGKEKEGRRKRPKHTVRDRCEDFKSEQKRRSQSGSTKAHHLSTISMSTILILFS